MTVYNLSIRRVVHIAQSPMNPLRWLIRLSCGHETWLTRKAKPTVKTMSCNECANKPK